MSRFSKAIKKAGPVAAVLNPTMALSTLGPLAAKDLFKKPGNVAGPSGLSDEQIASIVGDPSKDAARITENRKKYLDEMATMLSTQSDQSFKRAIPMLAEDANTKGIFTSTGFGDSLAREYKGLQEDNSNKLAIAGLDTGDAALQRTLSLEDYGRDLKSASVLGSQYAPKVQKPGKVGPTAAGAVSGGAAGAPLGPGGAAAGATIGALGGMASAKGK